MARLEELEVIELPWIASSLFTVFKVTHNLENELKRFFPKIEQGQCLGFPCDLVLAELIVKPLREGRLEIAVRAARRSRRIRSRFDKFSELELCLPNPGNCYCCRRFKRKMLLCIFLMSVWIFGC